MRLCADILAAAVAALLVLLGPGTAYADAGDLLKVGDRLKVTFYETMEVPDPTATGPKGDGPAAVMQTFFQRVDLSGEYAIEPGGGISLPLFDSLPAAGKPAEALRSDLRSAFEKAFGRQGGVTLAVVQRSPIFVVGAVKAPGSYPYMSGMIVLQALALAGGRDRDQLPSAEVVEMLRETERNEASRTSLKRLLARRAALVSRRDNLAKVDLPERLRELAGDEEAAALVSDELRLFRLQVRSEAGARLVREASLKAAGDEVDMLKVRLANFGTQLSLRSDRLRSMEALFARQVVESERVADVRRDVVDMEGRKRDFEVGLLQAQLRQVLARQAVDQGELQDRLSIERQVADLDAEIATAERGLAISTAVISVKADGTCCSREPDGSLAPRPTTYEIVRSGPAGAQMLSARDVDAMEPGDVLRVVVARPADRRQEASRSPSDRRSAVAAGPESPPPPSGQ